MSWFLHLSDIHRHTDGERLRSVLLEVARERGFSWSKRMLENESGLSVEADVDEVQGERGAAVCFTMRNATIDRSVYELIFDVADRAGLFIIAGEELEIVRSSRNRQPSIPDLTDPYREVVFESASAYADYMLDGDPDQLETYDPTAHTSVN